MTLSAFDWTCERLEARTDLTRIEARGTVRIALEAAGFDPRTVSREEMAVVLRKRMPAELASRRVSDPGPLCEELALGVCHLGESEAPAAESPEQIFARLGR